jgi:uncharacterized damage-inducible protein DinB
MSLGELAFHIAMIPRAIADLASLTEQEVPTVPRPEAKSVAELTSMLAAGLAHATEKLRGWGDGGLDVLLTLTRGGKPVLQMPRYNLVRAVMLNHWYHHRAQLTLYFRLLGLPVPAVYGGSADEVPF